MCIVLSIISATKEHLYSLDSHDVGRLSFVVTFTEAFSFHMTFT